MPSGEGPEIGVHCERRPDHATSAPVAADAGAAAATAACDAASAADPFRLVFRCQALCTEYLPRLSWASSSPAPCN